MVDGFKASLNSPLCIFVCPICLSFHSVEDHQCMLPVPSSKHSLGARSSASLTVHDDLPELSKLELLIICFHSHLFFVQWTEHLHKLLENQRYSSLMFYPPQHRPLLFPVMSLSLLLRRRDSVSGIQGMSSSLGTSSTWSRQVRARPQLLCCMKNW